MKFYYFLFLFGLSLHIRQLQKYSYEYLYPSEYLYLDISDFKRGDKIYLEASFCSIYIDSFDIYYLESDTIDESDLITKYFQTYTSRRLYETYNGYDYIIHNYVYDYTFYYTLELQYNYNYLILESKYAFKIKVRHTNKNSLWIVFLVLGIIVSIGIIIGTIIICIRRCKSYASVINEPLNSTQPIYPQNPSLYYPSQQPYYPSPPPYYQSAY